MAAPNESKLGANVTEQISSISDTTRFYNLNLAGDDWAYWLPTVMKTYLESKEFRQRFNVSASTNQLTVTENGGTLPSGTENVIARKMSLFQYPGGKKLLYPDDYTFLSGVITLNAAIVLPVAATYELIFKV